MPRSLRRFVPATGLLPLFACGIPQNVDEGQGTAELQTDAGPSDDLGPPAGDGDDPCIDRGDGGYGEGQRAENWAIQTADGYAFELYDHCGDVILIEIGAQW